MNFENFTLKAQELINNAVAKASEFKHQALFPEHLVLSLLEDRANIGCVALEKLGVNLIDL